MQSTSKKLLCPECKAEIEKDWAFCTCGYKLFDNFDFVYDQLIRLMEQENARREHLDSKASTYIGLLSIAVTILTTFGGIVALQGSTFLELTNSSLKIPGPVMSSINIIYILTVLSFIVGVIFAFLAFNEGSTILPKEIADKNDLKYQNTLHKCFWNMDLDYLADNIDQPPIILKIPLIEHLREIIDQNYKLNNEKSNKVIWAYWLTLFGIGLLLALTVLIGAIGLEIV